MAYVRAHETSTRRKGKPVKRYEVVWREPARDKFGLPIPVNPERPDGPKKMRSRQETYPTREAAEARAAELNAAKHSTGTSVLAEQRRAGELPFGHYARGWLDSQAVKVASGKLKQSTLEDNEALLQRYVLERFGARAIASITPRDAEDYLASLVRRRSNQGNCDTLAPATVKHAWATFNRVMKYALRHGAIIANPCDRVDFSATRATGDKSGFEHHPLTAAQVGALSAAVSGVTPADYIGPELPAYPIYGLIVEFMAYTGLRASEVAGLEVQDLIFSIGPTRPGAGEPAVRCSVQVRRTKERRNGVWVTGTPKSKRSRRSVPLPPWLAEKMRVYVLGVGTVPPAHGRPDDPTAPLWPSRKNGGGYRAEGQRYAVPLDWSQPLAMGTFYNTIMKPALAAIGLPVSRPARVGPGGEQIPARRGVRLHDLRHTFAVLQLSAGTHFMQVSKWLGHSTYTLTLDVYGDYIPDEDGGAMNTLPEPPNPGRAQVAGNVLFLRREI